MLLIACFVILEITGNIECIKPRSVNVALETVLAFENKDSSANVKFIDDVQNFLTKVKKVVKHKTPQRRNIKHENSVRFTEFVTELISILKNYQDDDLKDIFAVLDDEIRKYHYKGCKFYELVSDQYLRRSVAQKLDTVKEKPAKVIRKKLDTILKRIKNAKYDAKESKLLNYIESLYTTNDEKEFSKILNSFRTYKYESKRTDIDLIKMVRDGIRFTIFDHYSGLNINTRRDIQSRIEAFFYDDSEIKNKPVQRHSTVVYTKMDRHKKNNFKTTEQDKEFFNVLIKEVTPFNRYKKRQSNTTKDKKKVKKDIAKQKMLKDPKNNDDYDADDKYSEESNKKEALINDLSEITDFSSDSKDKTDKLQFDRDDSSSRKTDLTNRSNQKQLRTPQTESSESQSFDKRRKVKDDTNKLKNDEDDVADNEEGLSDKNLEFMTNNHVTLMANFNNSDELETTNEKKPMQTLRQSDEVLSNVTEKLIENKDSETEYKKKQSDAKQKTKLKNTFKHRNGSRKDRNKKDRSKKRKDLALRTYKNGGHLKSREESGIRFIISGRTTIMDTNIFRVKGKKHKTNDSEDEHKNTNTTERHKTNKPNEDKTSAEKDKKVKKHNQSHKIKQSKPKSKENPSKKSKSNIHKEKSIEINFSEVSKKHNISQISTQESKSIGRTKSKKATLRKKQRTHKVPKHHKADRSSDEKSLTYEEKYIPIQKYLTTEDSPENNENTAEDKVEIVKSKKDKVKNKKSDIETEKSQQSNEESEIDVDSTERSLGSDERKRSDEVTANFNDEIINDRRYLRASLKENNKIPNYKHSEEGLSIEPEEGKPLKHRRTNIEIPNENYTITIENNNIVNVKLANNTEVNETENSTNVKINETNINNAETNVNNSLSFNVPTNKKDEKVPINVSNKRNDENFEFVNERYNNYTDGKQDNSDLGSERLDGTTAKTNPIENDTVDVEKLIHKTNDTTANDSVKSKNETVNDNKLATNDELNIQLKETVENSIENLGKNLIDNTIEKNDVERIEIKNDTNSSK